MKKYNDKGIIPKIKYDDGEIKVLNFEFIPHKDIWEFNYMIDKKQNNNYYTIYINYTGESVYNSSKGNININSQELILAKPYEKISISSIPMKSAEYCFIFFSPSVFDNDEEVLLRLFFDRNKERIYRLNNMKNGVFLISLFRRFIDYSQLNLGKGHFKAVLKMILSELCTEFDKNLPEIAEKYSQEYDAKIYDYISRSFHKNITVGSVSEMFFVSPWYINELCKKFYQHSFKRTILIKRMTATRRYLTNNPNLSLKKIAEMVGYKEYSAFYKVYLNYYGITPKEDVKLYKETGEFKRQ